MAPIHVAMVSSQALDKRPGEPRCRRASAAKATTATAIIATAKSQSTALWLAPGAVMLVAP